MKIEELLEKGFIRREGVKPEEMSGSISMAKHFLERAEGNMEMNFYDTAFLLAYNSMFHVARALLFKAGYKERGHFAMVSALEQLYKSNKEILGFVNILNSYRISRHAIQYSGELSSELESTQAIKDCKAFLKFGEKFMGK